LRQKKKHQLIIIHNEQSYQADVLLFSIHHQFTRFLQGLVFTMKTIAINE